MKKISVRIRQNKGLAAERIRKRGAQPGNTNRRKNDIHSEAVIREAADYQQALKEYQDLLASINRQLQEE